MPVERTANFKRVRVAPKGIFDRRSFRVVSRGSHRIVIGCPRGHYDAPHKRCKVGTKAQVVLHPLNEHNPCFHCQMVAMGFTEWPA